jgi:uncharacterized protein (UPF0264 family)
MKIITAGLTDAQRVEAVTKAAHVDEHRARAMLDTGAWDTVVVDGNVVVGPSIYDIQDATDSAAAGALVGVEAHAQYGEALSIGGSASTLLVTPTGGETALVRG